MSKPPLPTLLNDLKGDPGNRRKNTVEPTPPPGYPEPPAHLSPVALEAWEDICVGLESMGLLSKVDATAIETYATHYAAWREALEHLDKEGRVYFCNKRERLVVSEWHRIAKESEEVYRKYLIEFGFTPSARARMRVPAVKKKADSKWGNMKIAAG